MSDRLREAALKVDRTPPRNLAVGASDWITLAAHLYCMVEDDHSDTAAAALLSLGALRAALDAEPEPCEGRTRRLHHVAQQMYEVLNLLCEMPIDHSERLAACRNRAVPLLNYIDGKLYPAPKHQDRSTRPGAADGQDAATDEDLQ